MVSSRTYRNSSERRIKEKKREGKNKIVDFDFLVHYHLTFRPGMNFTEIYSYVPAFSKVMLNDLIGVTPGGA
jgi:hypothetical protein